MSKTRLWDACGSSSFVTIGGLRGYRELPHMKQALNLHRLYLASRSIAADYMASLTRCSKRTTPECYWCARLSTRFRNDPGTTTISPRYKTPSFKDCSFQTVMYGASSSTSLTPLGHPFLQNLSTVLRISSLCVSARSSIWLISTRALLS